MSQRLGEWWRPSQARYDPEGTSEALRALYRQCQAECQPQARLGRLALYEASKAWAEAVRKYPRG